ncbi:MAG: hypothetical protein ACRCVN_05865, partial [Spirochaetia bacterium]
DTSVSYEYAGALYTDSSGFCEKSCECTGEELFREFQGDVNLDVFGERLLDLLDQVMPVDGGYSNEDIAVLSNRLGLSFEGVIRLPLEAIVKDLLLYTVISRMGLNDFQVKVLGEAIAR